MLERLSPMSPFGKAAAREPRWYAPGQEAALEEGKQVKGPSSGQHVGGVGGHQGQGGPSPAQGFQEGVGNAPSKPATSLPPPAA